MPEPKEPVLSGVPGAEIVAEPQSCAYKVEEAKKADLAGTEQVLMAAGPEPGSKIQVEPDSMLPNKSDEHKEKRMDLSGPRYAF